MRPKKLLYIVLLASHCLALTPISHNKVKFVYDGDTVLLESGEQVRYLGIDTPEVDHNGGSSEFMANTAWHFNRKMVESAPIRLEHDVEKRDQYGRLLAYVFLTNGEMVNALLVRQGLAHITFKSKALKYRGFLLDCQRKAMKEKLGIWGNAIKRKAKIYLGNKESFRFHHQDCYFAKKVFSGNRVRFKTRRDAFWEGYCPCKQCCP